MRNIVSMKLGEKIRRLRIDRNMSARTLAEKAEQSGTTVNNIEDGTTSDPGVCRVHKIASILGVSLDWLVDDSQGWPPPAGPEQQVADMVRKVFDRAGLAGEITDQEREVLAAFRSLDAAGRSEVLGYCRGLSVSRSAGKSETSAPAQAGSEADLERQLDSELDAEQNSSSHVKRA